MSRTLSIFLDLVRFLAALVVVVDHLGNSAFSTGWPEMVIPGVAAVAVFFVLSGFVISFVATHKEDNALKYAAARLSRLYSVLVPAVLLAGVVSLVVWRIAPDYLAIWTGMHTSLFQLHAHPVLRFLAQSLLSLSFLNSIHNHDVYPTLDDPMWSLGYEALYYAMFGLALFARGRWRLLLLAAAALLAGGGILRLLPVWVAGVFTYRLTERWRREDRRPVAVGAACLLGAVALAALYPAAHRVLDGPHSSHLLQVVLHGEGRAYFADLYYYFGAMAVLVILAVAALERALAGALARAERPIRWFAAHTFSIYLFHYPLLVLVWAVSRYNRSSHVAQALAFCTVIALCIALSTVSESKKLWWRDRMRSLLAPLAATTHTREAV